ncbi:MAG: transaldolase family protein [Patescibacteria group bacterium]
MKPEGLATRIYLDSGDPEETREIIDVLGFIDGQTTNPSLIVKNSEVADRLERGKKLSEEELLDFYRKIAEQISSLTPDGSVSLEVYADSKTTAEEMFGQGKIMFGWIDNAHIKYPITTEGLKAAELSLTEGMRVNMTLCFSQEQAAAVGVLAKNANQGDVFVSPFVGRLDDIGSNGMELIKNIITMYRQNNIPVDIITASVRNVDHLLSAIALDSDIVTAPFNILTEWADSDLPMPAFNADNISSADYQELDLSKPWQEFDLEHTLTEQGIEKFAADWNNLLNK